MNVEICSQHTMPVYKMSMGVFLLDQCPMCAKFAAVDHDGIACWFSEKPVLGYDNRWQIRGRSGQYRAIESDGKYMFFDCEHFKDSVIEKVANMEVL